MSPSLLDAPLQRGTGGTFVLPDEGTYIIEFRDVIDKKDWPKTGKGGEPLYDENGEPLMETNLTLQFVINDPDDEFHGVEFRDYYPLKITDRNKSGKLWSAFWGGELPEPLPSLRAFVGKRAQASLIHRIANNGNTYMKIDSVMPLRKKKQRAPEPEDEDGPGF